MQAPELTVVTILRGPDHASVLVSGDLDRNATRCLCAQLAGLRGAGVRELRMDLSGVRHHDRSLLHELIVQQARQHNLGGHLIITSVAPALLAELAGGGAETGLEITAPVAEPVSAMTARVPAPRWAEPGGVLAPETANQP
jgi:anti-anti-sigma regulatory factor